MTSHVRAILFDMDNTLFDFVAAKRHACRMVVSAAGRGDPDVLYDYFRRPVHGYESHEHIRDFLNDTRREGRDLFTLCCRIYDEEKLTVITPYPGIPEIISGIRARNGRIAVITDAERPQAEARLRKCGLYDAIDHLVTFDATGRKKPDPAPFLAALGSLGVEPGEAILVGDSIRRDITPARALGIRTIYAAYGDPYGAADLDPGQGMIARDIGALGRLLFASL